MVIDVPPPFGNGVGWRQGYFRRPNPKWLDEQKAYFDNRQNTKNGIPCNATKMCDPRPPG